MRVLFADHRVLLSEAIAIALQTQDLEIQTTLAVTLQRALDLCWDEESFDIIVLSDNLPGMANLSGLLSIRDACPLSRILLLTDQPDAAFQIRARELGAAAVLSHQAGWDELMALIKHLGGAQRIFAGSAAAHEQPRHRELTRRERDVLDRLIRGQSNKEIARDLAMAPMTVAMHLTSIFRKLGVSNRLQAVALALRRDDN
ncbi:LuxR family two component transcriptional regulator [Dongia mobilis]|uniref:LuxR family two component transcriptional regulator n=1 Tax=Dongia mobilis TaxID=578943 RepID=A0A4R6WVP0_9PROT|nr:response regulator transcription factor [Dongia mobilis]TDQ84250.1 LuxR family two component transcriptional regulator [Dongia mobilis]